MVHQTQPARMRHHCPIGLGAGISCDQAGEVRQGMTCIHSPASWARACHHQTRLADLRYRIQLSCRDLSSASQLGVMRAAANVDVGSRGVSQGRGNPAGWKD